MTRPLAPLYLAAGMVSGLWLAPGLLAARQIPTPPPRGAQEGGILSGDVSGQYGNCRKEPARPSATSPLLSQLDALDARIAALAYPDPRHCDDACLTGVERVELRRGVVSCRCRKLPSLGVHRLPEAGR